MRFARVCTCASPCPCAHSLQVRCRTIPHRNKHESVELLVQESPLHRVPTPDALVAVRALKHAGEISGEIAQNGPLRAPLHAVAIQATANISMPGIPYPSAVSVTVNNSYPSVSHRLTSWLDADGSVSGRGRPTLIASARTGGPSSSWWLLDTAASASPCGRAWDMWLCDARPVVSLSM